LELTAAPPGRLSGRGFLLRWGPEPTGPSPRDSGEWGDWGLIAAGPIPSLEWMATNPESAAAPWHPIGCGVSHRIRLQRPPHHQTKQPREPLAREAVFFSGFKQCDYFAASAVAGASHTMQCDSIDTTQSFLVSG